jgi:putative Mn2+ efflux pump MntP
MVFRVKFERECEADSLLLFRKSYKHHCPFLGDNQKAQQRKWYLIIQTVIIRKAGLLEVFSLGLCFSFDSCDFYFFVGAGFSVCEAIMALVIAIGLVAFLLSFIGFNFGSKLGKFFERKVQIIGGVVLIVIGIKILLENLIA